MKQTKAKRSVFFIVLSLIWVSNLSGQKLNFPLVHQEPYHKPHYEDETIRLLDVRASKNDTTSFHLHCLPIVYITLSGAEVALQTYEGDWKRVPLPTGWIGHDIYEEDSCFTHRFSVVGGGDLQIAAIEFKKSTSWSILDNPPEYESAGITLVQLSNLDEPFKDSWPTIAIGRDCNGDCELKVILNSQLSQQDFREYKLYQINYSTS